MSPQSRLKAIMALAASALFAFAAAGTELEMTMDDPLRIDPARYEVVHVIVDDKPLSLRRYDAVYARHPVDMAWQQPARRMGPGGSPAASVKQSLSNRLAYQSLHVFVPEGARPDAAIILNVNNGGWFASELRLGIIDGGSYVSTNDNDKVGAALAAGYVYVDIGTRGRGIVAEDGTYPGKAPAAVVDTKAAIRWLRLNDAALPGSAERIVVTGTSGGGGLAAIIAASGDSSDFLPDLKQIGAAGITANGQSTLSDAVFAAIAYCPITDLGHADLAYEWLYGHTRSTMNTAGGKWTNLHAKASTLLAERYAEYLASLQLKGADGRPLTAEAMRNAIISEVTAAVQIHLANGGIVPERGTLFHITVPRIFGPPVVVERTNDWVTVRDGHVTDFNLEAFLAFVASITPLKPVPAFDRSNNTGNLGIDGENTLFGSAVQEWSHFTAYGWEANEVLGDGSGRDDKGIAWERWLLEDGKAIAQQLRMIDPFAYLRGNAKVAPHWYVRHGMIDRDTALPIVIALAHALRDNTNVRELSFSIPWLVTHRGDYDVQEAYRWLARALAPQACGASLKSDPLEMNEASLPPCRLPSDP